MITKYSKDYIHLEIFYWIIIGNIYTCFKLMMSWSLLNYVFNWSGTQKFVFVAKGPLLCILGNVPLVIYNIPHLSLHRICLLHSYSLLYLGECYMELHFSYLKKQRKVNMLAQNSEGDNNSLNYLIIGKL